MVNNTKSKISIMVLMFYCLLFSTFSFSAKAQTLSVTPIATGSFRLDIDNIYSWSIEELVGGSWVSLVSGGANSSKSYNYTRPVGTYKFRLYNCYPITNGCSYSGTRTIYVSAAVIPSFDTALWRLASRQDRYTLGRDASTNTLKGDNYFGTPHQQWRISPLSIGSARFKITHQETGSCLAYINNSVTLAACGTTGADFAIEQLRNRTESQPAIYHVRINSSSCILPNSTGLPFAGTCNDSARWYIEPVGFNERHYAQEYEVRSLLIVKPQTNVPGVNVSSLSTSLMDIARSAFEINMPSYFSSMTDGRVKFTGSTVVSNEPIKSLTSLGLCLNWYVPLATDIPNDVQRYVTQGNYDEVQVFFSGNTNVGGCGLGRAIASNHSMWTTVSGVNSELNEWLDPLTIRSKSEIFIHEPMHGYDDYHGVYGLAVPNDGVHSTGENHYGLGAVGWMHWYRDYWLGTVIAADDTYRGYGPRMFRLPTTRQAASAKPQTAIKIVQATSGKCFIPQSGSTSPANSELLVLTSNCSTAASSFILEQNGMLKHRSSGKCVHPQNGTAYNNTNLVLFDSCNYEYRLQHGLSDGGSLKNIENNRCVHPNGGSSNPSEGTTLLYHDGCDEDRLRFKLVRH